MSFRLTNIWLNLLKSSQVKFWKCKTSQKKSTKECSWVYWELRISSKMLFIFSNFYAGKYMQLNMNKSNHLETLQFLRFRKYLFKQAFLNFWLKSFTCYLSLFNRLKRTISHLKTRPLEIESLIFLRFRTDFFKR